MKAAKDLRVAFSSLAQLIEDKDREFHDQRAHWKSRIEELEKQLAKSQANTKHLLSEIKNIENTSIPLNWMRPWLMQLSASASSLDWIGINESLANFHRLHTSRSHRVELAHDPTLPPASPGFIVTGLMRSGTTYLSSILNSQPYISCLEDYPWREFSKQVSCREEFMCLCGDIEAKFIYLGLPLPDLRSAKTSEELINIYNNHVKNLFGAASIGFKRTMLPSIDIKQRIREGWKIIRINRDTQSLLSSWINRIYADLSKASVDIACYKQLSQDFKPIDLESILDIEYNDLVANNETCLQSISAFLGTELKSVKNTYHSFNKYRQFFVGNSSFREQAHSAPTLAETLPRKYSEQEIADVSFMIDSGRIVPTKGEINSYLRRFSIEINL